MKTQVRKPYKLILACMTHSKHVQIDCVLMILTQFLMYFLEIFLGLAQKRFHFHQSCLLGGFEAHDFT